MDDKKINELIENLTYHELTEGQADDIATVRALSHEYAKAVGQIIPDSRHASLFATHFEDAVDRAIRAIVVGNVPIRQLKLTSCSSPAPSSSEVSTKCEKSSESATEGSCPNSLTSACESSDQPVSGDSCCHGGNSCADTPPPAAA